MACHHGHRPPARPHVDDGRRGRSVDIGHGRVLDGVDPDCTGPCDDDESSLATGLPDADGCERECFFDGNHQPSDGCSWDPQCDPLGPGAAIGCAYEGGAGCPSLRATQSRACIADCATLTPRGCDCFGCCPVPGPDPDQGIFLGSPGCELDDLDACLPCTPQIEACGRPCDHAQCQLRRDYCFDECCYDTVP